MTNRLSSSQKKVLLDVARRTLSCRFDKSESLPEMPEDPVFSGKSAAFVTLKLSGRLRGCIGHLEPVTSLWESVKGNTLNAAFHDRRFSPLSREEFKKIEIDVSILSSPVVLEYTDPEDLLEKLKPGIDGVILSDGRHRATFLPQVWKQLSSKEVFLGQLCRKAGLEETAWKKKQMEIKVYQVLSLKEEEM